MTFADFYYAVRGILGTRPFTVQVQAEYDVHRERNSVTWSVHVNGKVVGGFFFKPEFALNELRKKFPPPPHIESVGDPNEIKG